MKTKIIFLLAAGIFLFISCQKDLVIQDEILPVKKPAVEVEGTLVAEVIHSPSLEGNLLGDPAERNVNVYLPKSYYTYPKKRFPVIYYLYKFPLI